MIGDHSISVITDGYLKGISDINKNLALEAMLKGARRLPEKEEIFRGRIGLKEYINLGYVPADKYEQSVSRTLEYAYDDFCLAKFAEKLGKHNLMLEFENRANNFNNVFDKNTGFMRGKNSDGQWAENFDPFVSGYHSFFTEGNAWQYTWFVPHNIEKLIEQFGGKESFIRKLDAFFSIEGLSTVGGEEEVLRNITGMIGQYTHGNEPNHHVPYLYNYAGKPEKTQTLVYKILETMYRDKPDGLAGNDDLGQTSSWFVFSSLGFYPICPCDNKYALGTTLFNKSTIKIGKKDFIINTIGFKEGSFKVKEYALDNRTLHVPFINFEDIKKANTLTFIMK
jgi:predicted alpha-1,2-mannosidase